MFRFGLVATRLAQTTYKPLGLGPLTFSLRTATKKAGGTVVNKQDSPGQRLGLKITQNSRVETANILIRQRGFKWHPGLNVYAGKDHTLHAKIPGYVRFFKVRVPGKTKNPERCYVNVLPDRYQNDDILVEFAARLTQKFQASVAYRQAQRDFMALLRKEIGPNPHRDEYVAPPVTTRWLHKAAEARRQGIEFN